MTELGTRAVLRNIEAGLEARCPDNGGCGDEVKFLARIPSRFRRRVVANVYWLGKWNRVEQWHLFPCYVRAGMPHGRPPELKDEDLAIMERILERAGNPWEVSSTELLDELVAEYRRMRGDLHVATV